MANTGYKSAKRVAEKLRAEKAAEDRAITEAVKQELSGVVTAEMQAEFTKNATIGSEELGGGKLPLLKIYKRGRSQSELESGDEPNDGWYFYGPNKSQYERVTCHFLKVSRGFYAEPLEGSNKDKQFNQILGGMMVDNGEYLPFIMYLTGMKLAPFWKFTREDIAPLTKGKMPIPMFALAIEMGSQEEDSKFGKNWVPTFKLLKDEASNPLVVSDMGLFAFLRDSVDLSTQMIDNIINSKEIAVDGGVMAGDMTKDQLNQTLGAD